MSFNLLHQPPVNLPEAATPPIRVLHVLGSMNVGGLETWLMRLLRQLDRDRFHLDFLVNTSSPCHYDSELRLLSSNLISCPHPQRPWVYGPAFKRLLLQYGPYDIVHSHVHHFSGYILRLAAQVGIPVRIAHSHLDASVHETKSGFLRHVYLDLMRLWIHKYATIGLGCSCEAASDLFGSHWQADPRWQILHCGIDLAPFRELIDPVSVRVELNIPADAFVIGHVGRFEEQKNHSFLIDIAAEVAKRHSKTYLLLVGDGSLRSTIKQQVLQAGLQDRVVLTGVRSDVARLMRGAMDVFVMPSFYEGLPVAGIEAQAAGLPLVLSNGITSEIEIVQSLIQRVSLSQPASIWADAVLATQSASAQQQALQPLSNLETSSFNIANCIKALERVYVGE